MNHPGGNNGPSERTQRIEAVLIPVVAAEGMTLEGITVTPAGKRRLVRILVDRDVPVDDADRESPVQSLSLDEVGVVTRCVSDALDESDAMGEAPYVLEVSSPGTDRPLTNALHFRRNVGRLVTVTVADDEQVKGRLTGAGPGTFDLLVEAEGRGGTETERTFEYSESTRARIELEFNRRDAVLADEDIDDDTTDDDMTETQEQD